jgi:hypothetical protein
MTLLRGVADLVLGFTDLALDLAFGLFDLALGFSLLVASDLADAFLDLSAHLLLGAFYTIFVHDDSPLSDAFLRKRTGVVSLQEVLKIRDCATKHQARKLPTDLVAIALFCAFRHLKFDGR